MSTPLFFIPYSRLDLKTGPENDSESWSGPFPAYILFLIDGCNSNNENNNVDKNY